MVEVHAIQMKKLHLINVHYTLYFAPIFGPLFRVLTSTFQPLGNHSGCSFVFTTSCQDQTIIE